MYRILVVDDEKFIRKSICNRMDWAAFGIEVAGEAANGREALEQIESLRPQIVLADIRMPVMDGIAFITEAKKRYPQVHYILMSAYSDFEYAKQAIRLGVEDYILKPVKIAELEEVLGKIVHGLKQRQLTSRLLEPVEGGNLESLLGGRQVGAFAFYLESQEGAGGLLEDALGESLAKIGRKRILYYLKDFSPGDCHVFLMNGENLVESDSRELVEAAWDALGDAEGVAAYSEIMESGQATRAVESAMRLLTRKMFYPEKKILTARQKADPAAARKRQQQIREEMNYLYQNLSAEGAKPEKALEHIAYLAAGRENSIWAIENTVAEILVFLRKISEGRIEEADYRILFNGIQGKNYLLRYRTAEEFRERLTEVIHNCFCTTNQTEDEDVITAVRQYIRENYLSDLSAAETARRFYLNASYLSTLFKEKTGMNMGAYIEGLRMEKAKELLQSTQWPVTEVATRCGYSDSGYFTKVFKRYAGAAPRQFREQEKEIT